MSSDRWHTCLAETCEACKWHAIKRTGAASSGHYCVRQPEAVSVTADRPQCESWQRAYNLTPSA